MAEFKVTEARLRVIKQRQFNDRWGAEYVAGIFADPKEAPGISTGSILRPRKLGCREFHTLSAPETFISLLCLHHPDCWDIHEQRILYPRQRAHFLYGHARASGLAFKPIPGTIEIADCLGIRHPKVRLRIGNEPTKWPMSPFPFFGDLLLFMEDADGAYALNIPVKNKLEDFRKKGPRSKRPSPDHADDPGAVLRQRLEEMYYGGADIRNQPLGLDQLDKDLRWNLRDLFLADSTPINLCASQRASAIEICRAAIGRDQPAYVAARKVEREFKIPERDAVALLKQGVWRRELRVDLFRPVLMDKPLRPEVVDVFARYSTWFKR